MAESQDETERQLKYRGIPLELPIDFTTTAETKTLKKALRIMQKYSRKGSSDVVLLYRIAQAGPYVHEEEHRLFVPKRAKEIIKQDRRRYGTPLTLDWIQDKLRGILEGKYLIEEGRIVGKV